jgi:hypothetical protein
METAVQRDSKRERRNAMTRFRRSMVAALITIASHLSMSPPAGAAWDHAHGNNANTGFAGVDTAPALKPSQVVQLGTLTPGAGPVIGPSGMLYMGTNHGKVLAFQPDGTHAWTRLLPLGDPFLASPVVDAEGAVYLASSRKDEGRNHDGGTFTRYESTLHKLNGDKGEFFWSVPFPAPGPDPSPSLPRGPVAAAPPSIWRSGSIEMLVIPALYNYTGGVELRLLAFTTENGTLRGNTVVGSKPVEVTGSGWFDGWDLAQLVCVAALVTSVPAGLPLCAISYHEPTIGDYFAANWPMPGVAIAPDRRGGPPLVIVSDWLSQDTVGYRLDPASGFTEAFRIHDPARLKTSTPTVLPDGHIVMGTQDRQSDRGRVTFAGPSAPPLADRKNLFWIAAAPTHLPDGKFAVIQLPGSMAVFRDKTNTIFGRFKLSGESIASAAASCTHVFVASDDAFTTFDANTLRQVAQVPWSGGGLASPVIGPAGHVYGVMHAADQTDFLFVWPPPARTATSGLLGHTCAPVIVR